MGLHGILLSSISAMLASFLLLVGLGYFGAPFLLWGVVVLAVAFGVGIPLEILAGIATIVLIFAVKPLRTVLVTSRVMALMKKLGLLPKISEIRRKHPVLMIQVDGGISATNASQAIAAGATNLVAASAIFGQKDRGAAIAALRKA